MTRHAAPLLALLATILLLVPGCLDAQPQGDFRERDNPTSPTPPPELDYRPNLWLLDGPRPANMNTVSGGAEPSILVDHNGEFIWIGDTTGAYYSQDNGTSWTHMANFLLPSIFRDGWALAQDDTGRLYAAALTGPEIEVGVSTTGTSWDYVTRAAAVSGTTDRPWLAARGDGEVSMIYFDAPLVATGIYEACLRSTDAGRTWLDQTHTSTTPQAGNLVWTPDGKFHYVNSRGTLFSYRGTCLGGADSQSTATSLGANNMIQIASLGDELYSASANAANKAIQIWGNRGTGSPTTIKVSDPILQSSTFATIASYEPTQELAVAWYGSETPGDPSNPSFDGAFNVFVSRVTDFWGDQGGPFVETMRITDEPNHVGDICMGGIGCGNNADRDLLDYFMVDYDPWGGIHVAYGHDGEGSNAEVRYAHIPPNGFTQAPTQDAPILHVSIEVNEFTMRADATQSVDPLGSELTFVWNLGDGGFSEGAIIEHTYAEMGMYEVLLTATTPDGRRASHTMQVPVDGMSGNWLPEAEIAWNGRVVAVGETIEMVDVSTDKDGPIVTRQWDMGDGTILDDQTVRHVYEAPGNYSVTLTVFDDWGASDSAQTVVRVVPAEQAPAEDSPAAAWVAAAALLVALWVRRR